MNLFNTLFTPMLLTKIEKPFNDNKFLFEIKFDGIRCIMKIKDKILRIYSRNRRDITYLFPELQNISIKDNVIFDGEIVLLDKNKPSFLKLQERIYLKDNKKIKYQSLNNPVTFVAFDILYEKVNLMNRPLISRKKVLDKYEDTDLFVKSIYIENDGIKLFDKIKKLNLEGIVAKRKDSVYKINTRSKEWIKIKNFKEEKFIICGYKENKSIYTITLCLGELSDDKLYYVGSVVLNKNSSLYEKIINSKKIKNKIIDCKINCNYIEPKLKINIIYAERTNNNHLRHAVIKE